MKHIVREIMEFLQIRSKLFFLAPAIVGLSASSGIVITPTEIQQSERCRVQQSIPDCLVILKSSNPKLREAAVDYLGRIGPSKKSVLPYLFNALRDPDPMVRRSAAFGFASVIEPGDSYVKPAMPQLISILKDPTYQVRAGAGCALTSIGRSASTSKGVLVHITPLLKDRNSTTRGAIAGCMIRMGEYARSAAPQVFPLLQDSNIYARYAAEGFLTKLGYKIDIKH